MEQNIGKVVQVIGPVVDIRFNEDNLPNLLDSISIDKKDETIVVEVSQHLGNDTVRCISMGPTDGLIRGMKCVSTGKPIEVPVGEKTLGRLLDRKSVV